MSRIGTAFRRLWNERLKEALDDARIDALVMLHAVIIEPLLAMPEDVPTSGIVQSDYIPTESVNRTHGRNYEATPRLVIRWAIRAVPADLSGCRFIDVGAGRGRAVMEASRFGFRTVEGVEYSPVLAGEANRNIRACGVPDASRPAATVHCADALTFPIPSGDLVFYLFNPFTQDVMEPFLERIVRARGRLGDVFLIFVNADWAAEIACGLGAAPVALPPGLRLRIRAFSPWKVRICRF